ncbi:hypothetical protein ACFPIJ_43520 [Dactylosporangium cerinum]|uniref:Uncharacterized protein n=1 Tax=Dactylosporangium cerinum TaxID=1434730 RepID=A0ABV9W8M0_9ACTN
MATEEMLRGLLRWQHVAFAAGCVYRVAPLVEVFGARDERWTWRDAVEVLLDPQGPPADAACEPLLAPLRIVQRNPDVMATPQFLDAAMRTMRAALQTCQAETADDAEELALGAGWAADEVFESVDVDPAVEIDAQQRSVDAMRAASGASWADMVGFIRRDATDLTGLIERLAALGKVRRAGPLPARGVPRRRHAGHGGVALPVSPRQRRTLVEVDEREFVPDGQGRTSWRTGDVVELSCGFVDATVVRADEYGTGLAVPWHPSEGRSRSFCTIGRTRGCGPATGSATPPGPSWSSTRRCCS